MAIGRTVGVLGLVELLTGVSMSASCSDIAC